MRSQAGPLPSANSMRAWSCCSACRLWSLRAPHCAAAPPCSRSCRPNGFRPAPPSCSPSPGPLAPNQVVEEVDRVVGDRIPTIDDTRALSYTRATLSESLRLYPQVGFTSNAICRDLCLGCGVWGLRIGVWGWVMRHQLVVSPRGCTPAACPRGCTPAACWRPSAL